MRLLRCLVVDRRQQRSLDEALDGLLVALLCRHAVLDRHLHHAARVAVQAPHWHLLDVHAELERRALQHARLGADSVLHGDHHDLEEALQLRADHIVLRGPLRRLVLEGHHPLLGQAVVVVVVGLSEEAVQRRDELSAQLLCLLFSHIRSHSVVSEVFVGTRTIRLLPPLSSDNRKAVPTLLTD